MDTKFWTVDNDGDLSRSYPQITQAADFLQKNEVVAFPTETVYGLGANATSDEAVNKIFEAKGRPSDNPLIVHIANKEQLYELTMDIPEVVDKLISEFWPGPLTLVLKKKGELISSKVSAGLDTVAVRMPDHPVALELLRVSGLPLAAPSANLSGKPSPTTAQHVQHDLDGRIAGIIDGGPTGVGVESTVLDCTEVIPVILRPGGITREQLEGVCGQVEVDKALVETERAPKSPGMKYTHYAPKAPLYIVNGGPDFIQGLVLGKQAQGLKVGVLTTTEREERYVADSVITCGSRVDLASVATHLYDALRAFDEQELDVIYSEGFPNEGLGQAIMNRLLKAAGQRVIEG